ncbi:MAG: pyridoxal-phosphate dependent enzyme [Fimbriimonadaceae bacterium]|nr:pyridoxal-phosphate dependent enzyme [Fimbriimonadaceae bacterium]
MPFADRFPLIPGPSPLHPLPALSPELGLDLWIKRDDLLGFGGGGNKVRKVERLLGRALRDGAEAVVACGSRQSNFLRVLAAGCRRAGLRCEAVVMDMPFEPPARPAFRPPTSGGNADLAGLFGARFHALPDGSWEELDEARRRLAARLKEEGARVMEISVGGSSAEGVQAFVEAAAEIGEGFDFVVHASSSGSTQVGLSHAFRGTRTQVIGIACDPEPEMAHDLAALSSQFSAASGSLPMTADEFDFRLGWEGEGYNIPSPEGQAAIRRMAQSEGILLDPIYSAKAFAALLDLAKEGSLTGRVCFWHTGGLPNLFAFGIPGQSTE